MKNIIKITIVLFILHTLEETLTFFWSTDASIQILSDVFSLSPMGIYWSVQILLYGFLFLLLFLEKPKKFLLFVLGLILLFEFSHTAEFFIAGIYLPGLVSGTILGLLGLAYWYKFKEHA